MNIVHVETGMHLYGGARQVAYLADGMARRGHRVRVVCPPGAALAMALTELAGRADLQVCPMRCSGDADLGFMFRLGWLLKGDPPDLVHLHSRRGADTLGALAARWAGVPAVLSRRVDNPEPRWLAGLKYRQYARTICISQGIAEVLLGEGVDPQRLRVVRSALQPAPWRQPDTPAAFASEFGIASGTLTVGVVAQLIERKGHRLLFEALSGAQLPAWTLLVFGQGPERRALEQAAAQAGLAERVRFIGFRGDLQRWMGRLDLLVHPAWREGLGIALLQASAAGVPIVATRAGGIPEAVRDGLNGLLVQPGDVAGLRQAIERLANAPALRARLGQAGRELIDREFSVDAMVDGNLAVYRELLGPGMASRPAASLD